MFSNASGMFLASNLHVEIAKTIVQSRGTKHLGIFYSGNFVLPALGEEHISEKRAQIRCRGHETHMHKKQWPSTGGICAEHMHTL